MKYEIQDITTKTIYATNDTEKIRKELLAVLYNKYIRKDLYIKRIKISPHYDGTTDIIITQNNGYKQIFSNIPNDAYNI